MRVAVLKGGRSSEREVSLRSGAAVAAGLIAAGHEPVEVEISAEGIWLVEGKPLSLTPGGGLLGCDAAFPALHGPFGEDGTLQGVLETLDIPYVGATVLASAVCMDKITFKQVLAQLGFEQVGFCVAGEEGWREEAEALGLPLWVKPSRLGSSVGIGKVAATDELDAAVESARAHDPRVIVEGHSPGREIECSVIGNAEPEVSVPGEIVFEADWYDYESKYEPGGMRLDVPADIDGEIAGRLRSLAASVYSAVGCTGLARCDFFVEDGRILVNEINTIPGFTETSVFARLFEASGVEYGELCDRLVRLALERHTADRSHSF